jgi:hypothetical protein
MMSGIRLRTFFNTPFFSFLFLLSYFIYLELVSGTTFLIAIMGFSNWVSTFALVSLAFSSFNLVAARPHHNHPAPLENRGGHHHNDQTASIDAVPFVSTSTSTGSVTDIARIRHGSPKHSKSASTSTSSSSDSTPTSSSSQYPPLTYSLVKCYSEGSFFDQFNFYTGSDPTHGFVEYLLTSSHSANGRFVDQTTAQNTNLISESNGIAYIASDSTNVAPGGRKSVRLESKDKFNEVLIIADFTHLPSAYPLPNTYKTNQKCMWNMACLLDSKSQQLACRWRN